jgi:2-oxoglutarate dehydrogenase E2 component (dihydrolipoamide succinyltransferase)
MDVVVMPQLGETVTEGTITAWAVAVGDRVEVDQTLFEVSTDKVDTEVPVAAAGHVRALLVEAGSTVAVGTPVAVLTPGPDDPVDLNALGDPGHLPPDSPPGGEAGHRSPWSSDAEPVPATAGPPSSGSAAPAEAAHADADVGPGTDADATGRSVLSPVVRRLLDEHGIDPQDVAGSGRDGRITRADVRAAVAARRAPDGNGAGGERPPGAVVPAPVPIGPLEPHDEVVVFSRARADTAAHLSASRASAAHALVVVQVDYHAVEPVRRAAGLTYLPFVARAVVEALASFPHLNATVHHDRLVVRRRVHLGVAVDVDDEALVVPVLHNADQLRLPALGAALADLADRARRRRLTGPELGGGTFTLTNVGSHGTVIAAPIINRPQVATLSTDGVRMQPVAVPTGPDAWGVAVHPVGNLSLSFDHRAIDGAYAAAFLARVRDELQTRPWDEER